MDGHGLTGGSWPLPVDWRGDCESFARDLQSLPRFADTAATLGLFRTGTWILPAAPASTDREADPDSTLASLAAWHIERLGAIARVLDRFGVRLGLEVIGVASARPLRALPFVHRLADFDRRLGSLWQSSPNLGLIVDAFHLYAAGESVEAGLVWGVERIVAVHVADLPAGAVPDRAAIQDQHRGLPGENGAVDCRRVLSRLAEHGYQGPVTAEPLGHCRSLAGLTLEATARRVAAALRAVWPWTDWQGPWLEPD
jgi:sugar phosphate isomerase/epimerase